MQNKQNTQKGISLLISLFTITFLLAISFSISGIILRQFRIINTSISSEAAFYAADSALECVLYWDIETEADTMNTDGGNYVFGTSTATQSRIKCGPNSSNPYVFLKQTDLVNNVATSTFYLDYSNAAYPACAYVRVVKNTDRTYIETRGYNTGVNGAGCDVTDAVARRLVERGMQYAH
ncbi:MAG: hypothetical protein RJB39_806 [Candidatus Parcubacteria bacterium]|jgi:Tfp pilus assembly protein PilX